jgi:hypothetical protein
MWQRGPAWFLKPIEETQGDNQCQRKIVFKVGLGVPLQIEKTITKNYVY